ncbi:MAG: hypothetical protein NTZ84_01615 [Candidatus Nealsonbacteria bacterium]|nr:hypothetical protein [Candidatus Nealsonbacteria bacterium]
MFLKFPKFTPEFLILLLAFLIDSIGVILLLFGADDFGVLDSIGIATIGMWQLFKAGKITAPKAKKSSFLRKTFTGKWSKFFVTWGGELIPYVGCLPFWTWAVYYQLIQQEEQQNEQQLTT